MDAANAHNGELDKIPAEDDSLEMGETAASTEDGEDRRIPKAVIKRLSLYSRVLQHLERDKVEKVSSTELGRQLGLNSAQVRKDLAYFGQFGVPGFGYPVRELRQNIKRILGTDKEIRVALVGVGNLGTALLSYPGFRRQGFRLMCAFDIQPKWETYGVDKTPIYRISELEARIRQYKVDFAILAVPADAAQGVVDRLGEAGISGILNFVPCRIEVPEQIQVHYIDLALEMESLSYFIKLR
ncbi:MAG: redox-sensing transcriptional repressor Rex [Sumerlaeia bacterium]